MSNLHVLARECLLETRVEHKLSLTRQLHDQLNQGQLSVTPVELAPVTLAGRPKRPPLVSPREVPKRKLGSVEGRAAAIHAFCHIEFNAINLACDAVYRFQGLPMAYYQDWSRIAAEEAYHFGLLNDRLGELGHAYGDFPAHNGLWELAQKTAHDALHRMALIPRVMEARGLDVTPQIQQKFIHAGDQATADILAIILRDEITHVHAGTRWFQFLCQQRGLEPEATYLALVEQYMKGDVQCPMHIEARLEAGFSPAELDSLKALCQAGRKQTTV